MSKKGTKALASAALMSLVLTTALSAGPVKAASSASISRTSGADRYATAAQVAKSNWTTTDNVVLVSGEGYADSVSASALAKKLDAPILLTTPDTLSSDAESAIEQLKPKNIYVIGGNASISQSIRNNLKTDYNLVELGGANRYETNVAVAEKLVELGVSASDVLVVGGEGFSDALSVAPVAAAKGQILLLANNNESSIQSVIKFVKDNSSKVTVVGTKNVINDAIYNALGASTRVDGGTDRFATNLNVLNKFADSLENDKLYVANASPATPDNLYADALVASALAGKYTAPLVLVDKDTSDATDNAKDYIEGVYKDNSSVNVNVIGGTGVISDTLYGEIAKIIGQDGGDVTPEVSSINTVGLRQIKIVFSQEVDSDTAEDESNYKVDGTTLVDGEDVAVLQDDNKTVLITLKDARKQSDVVEVTVKKGILNADKASTIPEFTEEVTFNDTTAPSVDSVDVRGNNKITVEFSEPVNVGSNKNGSGAYSKFKINDKNLSAYGLNTSVDYTKAKDAVQDDDGDYWTNKLEFYFDSKIPTGNNTFKVSEGDESALEDAAGFPVAETTEDFNVDELSTTPEITSITANDDGKVYINFDRPMDAKTAVKLSYYEINNGDADITKAELKKDDTQVKLTVAGLNKGSNKLYIDDSVKDAYGNNIEEDTYESFELTEDSSKPFVTSVYALDDSTIRVRFSKDVDAKYGRNTSNYKLQDGDGTDVTSQIESIKVAGDTASSTSSTGSVFDLKLGKDDDGKQYKLTDSTYTITIKNIQDTASTPNVMDDYETTFDGSEDVNAEVVGVYRVVGQNKVTLVFNKEMDSGTLNDEGSYEYVNKEGTTKPLPTSAKATASSDNKSVTIDLSDTSLTVEPDSTKSDEYKIKSIYATKVKDADGNTLQVGGYGGDVTVSEAGAKVKANSLKVRYDGDDLKADVTFDIPIDSDKVYASDFSLNGIEADSASCDGKKITLTFESDDNDGSDPTTNINKIKAKGVEAVLAIKENSETKDVTGQSVTTGGTVKPYFYEAAPRTIVDDIKNSKNWTAQAGTNAVVKVVFDTPIDVNSVKAGDFTFSIDGTNADADRADVVADANGVNNTVRFTFDTTESKKFAKGDTITVKPVASPGIATVKDGNGKNAYYEPTNTDNKGVKIVIGEGSSDTTAPTLTQGSAKTITVGSAINLTEYFSDNETAASGLTYKLEDGTTISDPTEYSPAAGTYKITATDAAGFTSPTFTLTVSTSSTTVDWVTAPSYKGVTTTIAGKVDTTKVTSVKAVVDGTPTDVTIGSDGTFSYDVSGIAMGTKVTIKAYDSNNNEVNSAEVTRGL